MDHETERAERRPTSAGPAEPVLELVDLSAQLVGPPRGPVRRRHVEAVLRSVSLSLRPAERLGLAGGPGSGTTLISQVVAGAVAPASGGVTLTGRDLVGLRRRALRRACREVQVISPAAFRGRAGRQRVDAAVERMLARGDDDRSTDAAELALRQLVRLGVSGAGGRRRVRGLDDEQRVALRLARAAVLNPAVVVLDGISAGASPDVRARTLDVLDLMRAECGTAVLVLDGDLSFLGEAADTIGVLHGGRVVELADRDGLRRSPLHPLTVEVLAGTGVLGEGSGDGAGCGYREHCLRAKDRCGAEVPQLERPLGEAHPVACHFAGENWALGIVRLPAARGERDIDLVGAAEPTAREFAQG